MVNVFTDANFKAEVLGTGKISMIDFWATWCPPCLALGPTVDALAATYGDRVNIGKVNTDENPEISVLFSVTNIPCMLFVKDGKVVDKHIGLAPKSVYEKKIQKLLGE